MPDHPADQSIRLGYLDREAAERAIDRLRASLKMAGSVSDELAAAVLAGQIAPALLARHSKWCNSGGSWAAGVDPACAAARAMYGFVPERLLESDGRPVDGYEAKIAVMRSRIEGRTT